MDYRLYFMSPRTGHIERFEDFSAPDDEAAATIAERRTGELPVELWRGHNKLRDYPGGSGFMSEATHPPRVWANEPA